MLGAPVADAVDRLVRFAGHGQCPVSAVAARELGQVLPPSVHEPAVAPARPAAADVLLEQHDVRCGHPLAEEVGGPHPGVAAADDGDLGVDLAGERRCRGRIGFCGQRLPQPPAALGAGDRERRQALDLDQPGFTTMRMMIAMTRTARIVPTIRPRAPSRTNSSDCAPLVS